MVGGGGRSSSYLVLSCHVLFCLALAKFLVLTKIGRSGLSHTPPTFGTPKGEGAVHYEPALPPLLPLHPCGVPNDGEVG